MSYSILYFAHSKTTGIYGRRGDIYPNKADFVHYSCPSRAESNKFGIPCTKIGQLPTDDGLFGQLRSAYFVASQLSLTSVRKCVEFVVPCPRLRPPYQMGTTRQNRRRSPLSSSRRRPRRWSEICGRPSSVSRRWHPLSSR